MKFLIDVCAGGRLKAWLIEQGHDVLEVREIDQSMPDSEVLEIASNQNRIIITVDKDFGELLFVKRDKVCSVIRLPDVSFERRAELVDLVLGKYKNQLSGLAIITVSKKKIRIREL